MVEVIAFTGPFTYPGKYRNTTVLHSDIMDHFHHNDGLADAGAAEHPHLAASGEGNEQVDNFNAGFQHLYRSILLGEGRGSPMDRHTLIGPDGSQAHPRVGQQHSKYGREPPSRPAS